MFMNRVTNILTTGRLIGLVLLIVVAITACGQNQPTTSDSSLTFEIVENGLRFSPDETPIFEEDSMPAYGAEFITEGYIYPSGTITCQNNECNGVLEDGSPEFPDKVVGKWVCRGWFIGDGAHTTTGPWVATTQIYDLGTTSGASMIVTDGYELSDLNVAFRRAIVGGTGQYSQALGEQTQELLGFNPSFGVAFRVELAMSK